MAEKEERQKRLLIKEYDLVCDLTDCKYCEEKDWCSEKEGMTRQEAIERMAKAAGKAYRGYFYAEPNHPNISDMMEAALDALLGEYK